MLDISFRVGMGLPVNQNHTHSINQNEAARDGANPPQFEAASSIDIIVEILTRQKDEAIPFAGHWREAFLHALARAPIVTVAARIAGVSRARAIEERNADAEFARQWDHAIEEGIDEIEAAAYLSAVFGDKTPLFQHRKQIGWTVQHSHATRSMLLNAWRPKVFGRKETEEPTVPKMTHMTLEEFRKRVEEARQQ